MARAWASPRCTQPARLWWAFDTRASTSGAALGAQIDTHLRAHPGSTKPATSGKVRSCTRGARRRGRAGTQRPRYLVAAQVPGQAAHQASQPLVNGPQHGAAARVGGRGSEGGRLWRRARERLTGGAGAVRGAARRTLGHPQAATGPRDNEHPGTHRSGRVLTAAYSGSASSSWRARRNDCPTLNPAARLARHASITLGWMGRHCPLLRDPNSASSATPRRAAPRKERSTRCSHGNSTCTHTGRPKQVHMGGAPDGAMGCCERAARQGCCARNAAARARPIVAAPMVHTMTQTEAAGGDGKRGHTATGRPYHSAARSHLGWPPTGPAPRTSTCPRRLPGGVCVWMERGEGAQSTALLATTTPPAGT
jgi:hypothetical protein